MTKQSLTSTLSKDLPAALVVFFVALPLCLGIASASGVHVGNEEPRLVSGLIAGIMGGIVVGIFSGSHIGVSGPAAGLAVIVADAIKELGSLEVFFLAVVVGGVIQLILGFVRAGGIAYYFPTSVISGMLAGIGVLIFGKQFRHALGYEPTAWKELGFSNLGDMSSNINWGAVIICVVSLAILLFCQTDWWKKKKGLSLVPGPLIAVVTGMILVKAFASGEFALSGYQLVTLPIIDSLDGFKELFVYPDFSALSSVTVYKVAGVLAIVASLETLLCVEATDKLDPDKHVTPTNRELKAQGIGNIASGLVGGLPVTQVIVRSSANIQAGGKSKVSTIVHGFLLIAAVTVLGDVLNLTPMASLAAVLFVVGFKLAKPALFIKMYKEGLGQFVPFVATVLGIVLTDLLTGVGIGLGVSVLSLLHENFRLPFEIDKSSKKLRIVLAQNVSFLNKASIMQLLSQIEDGCSVEIDATESVYVHADVVEIIEDFVGGAKARDITVMVKGLSDVQKGRPGGGVASMESVREG